MTLFQHGAFKSHSGLNLPFKIECDALTDEDWYQLAGILAETMPPFSAVEGVPRGGIPLAKHLERFLQDEGKLLIVDDVYTTGNSMEEQRAGRDALGAVVFARGHWADWVYPLFVEWDRI